MPPGHSDEGIRAAKEIRAKHPMVAVLVLSQYVELRYAMDLLADGAERLGYLLKDRVSDVREFTESVKRVAGGGSAVDPAVISQLVGVRRDADPLAELTAREREVLELMAEGRSNRGIAAGSSLPSTRSKTHPGRSSRSFGSRADGGRLAGRAGPPRADRELASLSSQPTTDHRDDAPVVRHSGLTRPGSGPRRLFGSCR
jgi:FixJ family two-component response regulator